MAIVNSIKFILISLSFSAIIITTWLAMSRAGFRTAPSRCKCESAIGPESDRNVLQTEIEKCKANAEVLKKRLDWEMARADWTNLKQSETEEEHVPERDRPSQTLKDVKIVVNGQATLNGFRNSHDVYVPFSFVEKYFEIQGKYENGNKDVFEWKHAIIKPWEIPKKYKPDGEYVGLISSSVENRKRVKCIDGIYQVPVTNQWNKAGYFYATQIAQYGLAHYSKYVKKRDDKSVLVLDGGSMLDNWSESRILKAVFDKEKGTEVTHFETKAMMNMKRTMLDDSKNVISFDLKWSSGSSLIVIVKTNIGKQISISYVQNNDFISCEFPKISIGVGMSRGWRRMTRDVEIDFKKGVALCKDAEAKKAKFLGIKRILFLGSGYIGNLTLSATAHVEMLMSAANWLVKFQDKGGGWPVNCTRKIIPEAISPPGWHSAMGSGQAISLLCRVYALTKRPEYLRAAHRALDLFDISVENGGISSNVFGRYKMFEEYSTKPSLHVLNGFIFSLIGLFDLSQTEPSNGAARDYFNQGLETLLIILPMYDTGSGTFYDLRHIVIPGVEPKRARWDYHAVHLGQLELLKQITNNSAIDHILQRWTKYVQGIPSRHN